MTIKPSYDELVELLDNVSAALENATLYGAKQHEQDRRHRHFLALEARTICDPLLRQSDSTSSAPSGDCVTYPACEGGCGPGCTKESE